MVSLAVAAILISGLALVVAVLGLVLQYADFFQRRRDRLPPVTLELFKEHLTTPFETDWTIRIRSQGVLLEHCKIIYWTHELPTIVNRQGVHELMLAKGGAENFRIPAVIPINDEQWVIVKDGGKTIRRVKMGDIPRTNA